jgi:hypothetical protein
LRGLENKLALTDKQRRLLHAKRGYALPQDYGDRIFRPGAEINKRIDMGVIVTKHNKHFEDMTTEQQKQLKRHIFGERN